MSGPPTRGERNCSPGNLRYDKKIHWHGLAQPPQDDGGYCIFTTALWGIRALARDLLVANEDDGLKTVMEIIDRFAPASENNTAAYIEAVCDAMGVEPDKSLDLTDAGQLQVFAHAVILHENGRCIYPDSLISQAVQLALKGTI